MIISAIELGVGTTRTPGPGFLLFWSAAVLGALVIFLIGKAIIQSKEKKTLRDLWKGVKWINSVMGVIALCSYALLLTKLGFCLTTFSVMMFLFLVGKMKKLVAIIGALITTSLSYIIFHHLLHIQFPEGIFGW